jgi:hypothetical protein
VLIDFALSIAEPFVDDVLEELEVAVANPDFKNS